MKHKQDARREIMPNANNRLKAVIPYNAEAARGRLFINKNNDLHKHIQSIPFAIFAALLLIIFIMDSAQAELSNAVSANSANQPHDGCRLALFNISDRQPLSNETIALAAKVDGSQTEYSENFTSDATGIVDLSKFYQGQIFLLMGRYGERISWAIHAGGMPVDINLRNCRGEIQAFVTTHVNRPAVAKHSEKQPDNRTRWATITGHFENQAGERIDKLKDMLPEPVRHIVNPNKHVAWDTQIRLYQANKRWIYKQLQVDQDGYFTIDLPAPGTYRFDPIPSAFFYIATPDITVENPDQPIVLVVAPKPYCLYGDFFDAYDGTPTTEPIIISGVNANFSNTSDSNTPKSSHYVLFFDRPQSMELHIEDISYQKKYLPQTVHVNITEPLQRWDFRLQRLAQPQDVVRLHVEISGISPVTSNYVYFSIHGENHWSVYKQDNTNSFDTLLPKPGRYDVEVRSDEYAVEPLKQVLIDRDQTLQLYAAEKNTWLIVRFVDAAGVPIAFPRIVNIEEPPRNTVLLTRGGKANWPSYIQYGMGDVGKVVRPNDDGDAWFRLAKGGIYYLHTNFQRYASRIVPITIKTDVTTKIEIQLEEKGPEKKEQARQNLK
ncbi:MAG: hypothetical protein ACU837_13185 [Gammaproteobacteria bacterium]